MDSILDNDNELLTKGSIMLYEALTMERGIQGIVDIAKTILNNPVLVADTSFRVIAHAEKPDMNDKLWMEIVEQGFYPAHYVYSISRDKWQYSTRQTVTEENPRLKARQEFATRYTTQAFTYQLHQQALEQHTSP